MMLRGTKRSGKKQQRESYSEMLLTAFDTGTGALSIAFCFKKRKRIGQTHPKYN